LPGEAENNGVQIPGTNLGSNPFTLSYWIKPTTATANAGLERITSRGGDQFETGIGDAGAVGGTTSETGTTLSYYAGAGWQVTHVAITIDEWTHVTWVVSTEATILYVNGEEAYTGIGATEDKPGTNDFFIGTRHNSVEGYEGRSMMWLYGTLPSAQMILRTLPLEMLNLSLALLVGQGPLSWPR
jgi:hypothetical protein